MGADAFLSMNGAVEHDVNGEFTDPVERFLSVAYSVAGSAHFCTLKNLVRLKRSSRGSGCAKGSAKVGVHNVVDSIPHVV